MYEDRIKISLDKGKYEIIFDADGQYPECCLRYGEYWRDLVGDNLIFFLANELLNNRKEIATLKTRLNGFYGAKNMPVKD